MRLIVLAALGAAALGFPVRAQTSPAGGADHPGCRSITARQCVARAIEAMGGATALRSISSARLDVAAHTLLTEQSYRQAPFITAYDRIQMSVDFRNGVVGQTVHDLWPESDPDTASAESTTTMVATPLAAVVRSEPTDAPGSRAQMDEAAVALELGPERLLLSADGAPDLAFAPSETLRSTLHSVVSFTWRGRRLKVLINAANHLPDGFETTRSFNDFWVAWGDVRQRVYFDDWKLIGGIVYPTNRIDERNGVLWRSTQVLDAKFNLPLDGAATAMDPVAAAKSSAGLGWRRAFDDRRHVALDPGIDLFVGSWNVTLVRQDAGVLVLEAPISPTFTKGVLAKARANPEHLPLSGVLSTSDSWPHAAGVRQAVAEQLPVYVLDLNRPLLDRMAKAPHTERPDDLQARPHPAIWKVVSGKTEVGAGPNRVVLYPLRGAATERQYMVYFPERRLLYASDTIVIDADKQVLYDPELAHEVVQAVAREHLQVDRVFAMHQAPVAWSEVVRLVAVAAAS